MSITQFPHCDSRILHAPGECVYCDMNPGWQELRQAWGIAFTGHLPDPESGIVMCPTDYNRDNYNQWPGNTPEGYT